MLAMTYDATTKIFNGYVEVADENSVPANATLVKPNGIVQPYTWDGTDKAVWQAAQDAKQSEMLKEHPELALQPTAEQQQLAELIKSNAQQTSLNAQLIKQVAALQAQVATSTTQEVE